jgi:GNAT superfamily N-acetyltransferase
VHHADGYPSTRDQPETFLAPPHEVAAWVAVRDGAAAGHVALHAPARSDTVDFAASRLGTDDRYVLVSRLFVAPSARGRGMARALLRTVAGHARSAEGRPVLDVGTDFASAVSLYESEG